MTTERTNKEKETERHIQKGRHAEEVRVKHHEGENGQPSGGLKHHIGEKSQPTKMHMFEVSSPMQKTTEVQENKRKEDKRT